jgi:copper(I)-binding protein
MFKTILVAAATALFSTHLLAQTANVTVTDPWVRGTAGQQKATGAFMELSADRKARLVAASSPVAGVVEIHEMAMENNIMRMRQVPGIDVPAGSRVALKPGGYHVMLMELKQPLKVGEQVPITLTFEDEARQRFSVEIKAPVRALGAGDSSGHSHGHGHGHGHKH